MTRRVDLLLAVAFAAVAGTLVLTDDTLDAAGKAGALAMAAAVATALAFRTRAPLALAAVTCASVLARPLIPPGGDGVAYGLPALVATFSCAALLEGRDLVFGAALSAATAIDLMITDGQDLSGVVFYTLLFGAPWAAGRMTARLEAQRDLKAKVAVAEERERIARELHDVVSHAISVAVLQARGGRRVLDDDPEQARAAFDAIEQTSAQALAEMRRLLGLLRADDEGALAPQPTLARLDGLTAELRASGLPVELSVSGEPGAVPPSIDVSAFRIVQEALTNTLKHAGPARASVRVLYEPGAVVVEVIDDGRGTTRANGSGHGLVGMRERVAIAGGELDTGPVASGGYAVRARLPYGATT